MKNNMNIVSNERLMTYTKWSIFSVLAYYISFLMDPIVGAMKAGMFKIGSGMLTRYFDTNMARWGIEWSEHARALIFAVLFAIIGMLAIAVTKKRGINSKKSGPLFIILIAMSGLEIFFGFVIRLNWQGIDPRFKAAAIVYYLLPVLLFALVIFCFVKVLIAQGVKEAKQRKIKKTVSGFGGFLIIGMLRTFFISVSLLFEFLVIAFLCIPFALKRSITPRFIIDMLNRMQIGQCDGRMLLIILLGAIVGFTAFVQIFTKKASFKANAITLEVINIFYTLGLMTSVVAKYMTVRKIDWINFVYIAVSILFIVYYSLSSRVENTYIKTKAMAAEANTPEDHKQTEKN